MRWPLALLTTALAACPRPRAHSASAPAMPYVFVADLTTGKPVAMEWSQRPLEEYVHDLPPSTYVVSGVLPDRYVVTTFTTPLTTPLDLHYRDDCEKVVGKVVGTPSLHPVGFFPWSDPTAIIAVGTTQGDFAVCLPHDRYYAIVEGDDNVSEKKYFEVAGAGSTVSVSVWPKPELDTAPSRPIAFASQGADGLATAFRNRAQVIGIGEADHGASSSLQVRRELIFALAAQGRVPVLAIEAGAVETFALDDYVAGADIDVAQALRSLDYWIWQTDEFASLLADIRAYNAGHRDHMIHVMGVDLPQTAAAIEYVVENAERLGVSRVADALTPLGVDRAVAAASMEPTERDQLVAAIRAAATRTTGRDKRALQSVANRIDVSALRDVWRSGRRDEAMADMVMDLLKAEGVDGKVIVFLAHNGHIRATPGSVPPPAGSWLRKRLGRRYVAIGTFGYAGATLVRTPAALMPQPLPATPAGAFETVVIRSQSYAHSSRVVYIDFGSVPAIARSWLALPRRVREFGAAYPGPESDFDYHTLPDAYDAAAVIEEVVPSTPLRRDDN